MYQNLSPGHTCAEGISSGTDQTAQKQVLQPTKSKANIKYPSALISLSSIWPAVLFVKYIYKIIWSIGSVHQSSDESYQLYLSAQELQGIIEKKTPLFLKTEIIYEKQAK